MTGYLAMAETYTLKQISQELSIPEASVRYYRDALADFLPTIGNGRNRRYPEETLDLLAEASSLIRDDGLTLEQVGELWAESKALTINATGATDATSASATQQQDSNQIQPSVDPIELLSIFSTGVAQLVEQEGNNNRNTMQAGFTQVAEAISNNATLQQELSEARHEAQSLREENQQLKTELALEKQKTWWQKLRGRTD